MQKAKKPLAIIFILLQTALFYFAVFSNFKAHYFQYASIVFAFVFSLIWIRKDNYLIQIALFFTLIADTFLTLLIPLTPLKQILGMSFFALVQITYAIFLHLKSSQKRKNLLIIRICLTVIALLVVILVLKEKTNYLSLTAVFYYVNLILNLIYSLFSFKKFPLFAIGLVLFLFCDTFVGLSFIGDFIAIGESAFINFVFSLPFNIIWLFYLPSQTLISLQSFVYKKRTKKEETTTN